MTQKEMVLKHLESGLEITPLEALREYGSFRLAAIIYDLRRKGYEISSEPVKFRNRYGKIITFSKYRLHQSNESK